MKIGGEYLFAAPQDVVWDSLLDPVVLASVLPGCERLDRTGDNEYEGQLHIKVGPVQGTFEGKVTLKDIVRPDRYGMTIDGRGAPGFVKAEATLSLKAESGSTRLTYDSDAQVGGRIASVGQRLVESSARAIVKQSLEGLSAAITARAAAAAANAAGAGRATAPPSTPPPAPPAPSQAAFAVNVAKEVAKDLVPRGARLVIMLIVLVVVAVVVYRMLTG